MTTVDRKYAFTKVATGDYLLPSNDAQIIWRIMCYTDGPSNGLEIPRDRDFWGVWKWTGPIDRVDPDDWTRWEVYLSLRDSRADCVRAALA